jgi:spermidine synthase
MPSSRLIPVLVLFFLSGACGLTYQVLWLRQLSLVFGVTVYAASTVLAAFMSGLALGSLLAGRILTRLERPLVGFGVAEILIGLSALATPLALDAAFVVYGATYRTIGDSFGLLTLARLVCSFAVLLVPTTLMGLTLPLLSASSVVRGERLGSRVSALYAVNTAGAVTGVLLTGFYLIGAIGIARAFALAAVVNVVVGLAALALARAVPERSPAPQPAEPGDIVGSRPRVDQAAYVVVLGVVCLSGLASLALEIVWFRILVQFLPATTYAFTTMLATVLAGIALGGGLAVRLLSRPRDYLAWLAAAQLGTAIAAVVSLTFLGWSYGAGWRTSAPIQASAAAILPAAILMGLSFPIALQLGAIRDPRDGSQRTTVGRRIGQLYGLNMAGAIAGSFAGGFMIVPWLGVRGGLILLSAVYAVSALALAAAHPRRRRVAAAAGAGVMVFAILATRVPDPFIAAFERRHGSDLREFWRDEGAQTAVSVHASRLRRSLFLDGLHQANDTPEMVRLHRIIGHLPMVLHPSPASALVIGLGGGATPGAVSQHAGTRVQIVELSDGVRRAAPFFAHINYDVLNQRNVRLRVDDGRNFLMLTDERFDVVTADIIQPIHAGAGSLYSREYFTLVRRVLGDGGLVMQWIGHRPDSQFKLMMRTFLDVFPESTLWVDGTLLVGSLHPLRVSRHIVDGHLADARTRAALHDVGLDSFETLLSWYTAGPDEMRRFVGDGPFLTDDRPLVEYHRSLPADEPTADLSTLRGDVRAIVAEP